MRTLQKYLVGVEQQKNIAISQKHQRQQHTETKNKKIHRHKIVYIQIFLITYVQVHKRLLGRKWFNNPLSKLQILQSIAQC